MRRIGLVLLAVVMLAGCGGGGSTDPTVDPWAYENERYVKWPGGEYTKITGTLRNQSAATQYVREIHYRAWNGSTQLGDGYDFLNTNVATGGAVNYSFFVRTDNNAVTRWERWVTK